MNDGKKVFTAGQAALIALVTAVLVILAAVVFVFVAKPGSTKGNASAQTVSAENSNGNGQSASSGVGSGNNPAGAGTTDGNGQVGASAGDDGSAAAATEGSADAAGRTDQNAEEVSGGGAESIFANAAGDSKSEDSSANAGNAKAEDTAAGAEDSAFAGILTIKNSWQESGRFFYQYDLSLTNQTGSAMDGWKASLDFGTEVKLRDSWNCKASVGGKKNNVLSLKNAGYNASVPAGGAVKDIGFIMSTVAELDDFSGQYTVDPGTGTMTKKKDTQAADSAAASSKEEGKKVSSKENAKSTSKGDAESTAKVSSASTAKKSADGGKTPFEAHGALAVKSGKVVDKSGKPYQLKGVSTHGIAWFPQYVNEKSFKFLCTDGDKKELEAVIDRGVKAASDLGMYVIIDWHILHDLTPVKYQSQAEDFFKRMSAKYKDRDNVLYEICNEPNGGTSWQEIKTYAEDIIPIIRKNDPDALILVGTPNWSQDVDAAAADPLTGVTNVAYTMHFYAATHKDDLRTKLKNALQQGLPVFISEFSTCEASGDGPVDKASADAWKDLINQYNLSYADWSLSNKSESSAIFRPSCTGTEGGWTDADLSETGLYLKNMLTE